MLYKFTIVTDEVEDFLREIVISSEASFLDLSNIILQSCGYPDDQMTSFYICDDDWERQTEITREDMGTESNEEDIYTMEDTRICELVEDEHQRLKYIFDPFNERALYLELKEIILKKDYKDAICTRSRGTAPIQILQEEKTTSKGNRTKNNFTTDLENDLLEFENENDYDSDELDPEGFEIDEGGSF